MTPHTLYYISGTLWAIEMLPQIAKTYKRKSVGDISVLFPVICLTSFILAFTAHALLGRWSLLISQILPLICNIVFFVQVIIYRRNNES